MRIPKFVVLASAVILGTIGSLPAQSQRDDSDLQAKAREELRRKMSELESAPAATTPTPAPAAPVMTPVPAPVRTAPPPPMKSPSPPPMKTPPPAAMSVPPPAVSSPAPMMAQTQQPQDQKIYVEPPNPNRDKAEQMLRQKMAEMDAQKAATQPPGKTMTAPAYRPVATPPVSDDAKARAEADEVARTEQRVKAKVDAEAKSKTQTSKFPTYTEPPPVTAPPAMPASMSAKDQKLAVLLQQYRADQITPQQYHEQRARILAEP